MARLAVMTVGVLREPWGHAQVAGFVERLGPVFAAAGESQGYLGRSGYPDNPAGEPSWGPTANPTCLQAPEIQDRRADTLSLWQDLESIMAFAYRGAHGEAFGHRHHWFKHEHGPGYVAWWVAEDHTPTWQEGCARYDRLQREGPGPDAFDFKHPFDPSGQPTRVDRDRVKALVARNEQGRVSP
jgi:hypothetical protein